MNKNLIETVLNKKILPFVSKPGRYIGNELNIIRKENQPTDVSVALAFPDIYEIGMSFIGFEILYHVLNKRDFIRAERVYLPWTDMQAMMQREKLPLYSLESFTPLKEFDLVGFTLQYELTYSNVLQMLHMSDIPILAADRSNDDPIVIGGGPCSSNPEPMSDFFDAFLIGDGEQALVEICTLIGQFKQAKTKRTEILEKLAGIGGVYVPSLYEAVYDDLNQFAYIQTKSVSAPLPIVTRIEPVLKEGNYPTEPIVPILEVTHDRLALEVMRGCSEGCRYCSAGMIYRPVREREPQAIVRQSVKGIESSGFDEVSFLSLSISDYSKLGDLMSAEKESLEGKFVNVSLPSMRLDSFSEEIAQFVSSVRKSGFTFAPEAGSERLRKVINKNITDSDLFAAVTTALRSGWKLLKFYFMIGLPTEKEEDIHAIADLIEKVSELSKAFGRIRFNISISPFSPKPHTPFQWEEQNTKETLYDKVKILRTRLRHLKHVNINWRDPEISALECVLGRADRRMGKAIHIAWQNGAKLDGWLEYFNYDIWEKAIQKAGLSMETLLSEFEIDAPFPWDHIDKGVTKKFLKHERNKAYKEENTLDCTDGHCHACGIQRKEIFGHLLDCKVNEAITHSENNQSVVTGSDQKSEETQSHTGRKFRICYSKIGYGRYISHLDLIRLFERTCRRAKIPVKYSEGFNPHPKFSFAPPLTLGFSSESEYMDIEIDDNFNGDIKKLFNKHLPEGIRINDVRDIVPPIESLDHAIQFAEYEVVLSDGPINHSDFEKELNTFLKREEIIVQRKTKGKIRTLNIRPYIKSIEYENDRLLISTEKIDQRTVRIGEILNNLFPAGHQLIGSVHRKKQLVSFNGKKLTPLDVV
ncbi:MAG: TIGR03960 family B12-binding radical SAM protein [Calditrichaceae bacterium]